MASQVPRSAGKSHTVQKGLLPRSTMLAVHSGGTVGEGVGVGVGNEAQVPLVRTRDRSSMYPSQSVPTYRWQEYSILAEALPGGSQPEALRYQRPVVFARVKTVAGAKKLVESVFPDESRKAISSSQGRGGPANRPASHPGHRKPIHN